MTYTLKGLKTWKSHDGGGWQAKLLADGKVVAQITNQGRGGPLDWLFMPDTSDDVVAFGAAHGVADMLASRCTVRFDTDADTAVCEMVDALENAQRRKKQVRRWCKTETLFRLPEDKEGSYRTIKAVYAPPVRKFILQTYGPTVPIVNESL